MIAALSFWDYSLVANVQGSDTYKATGRCFSVAAGRISYSYGLKGMCGHISAPLKLHSRQYEDHWLYAALDCCLQLYRSPSSLMCAVTVHKCLTAQVGAPTPMTMLQNMQAQPSA